MNSTQVRSCFISDLHLGTPYCQSQKLLQFLEAYQSSYLYLVGDIIDTWAIGKYWYWDPTQSKIIDTIKNKTRSADVFIIGGNHDEGNVAYLVDSFPNQSILEASSYTTLNNRKLLITHGHQFDGSLIRASSNFHFSLAMLINNWYYSHNRAKNVIGSVMINMFGNPRMQKYYNNISKTLAHTDYIGIVTGHTHKPSFKKLSSGYIYMNTGDWISNCTALVETLDGEIKLIKWSNPK